MASISARSSGERSASSLDESHLPAMTSDHSGRASSVPSSSPSSRAPASMRMASPKLTPPAWACFCTSRHWSSTCESLSRSTSTHLPLISTRPSAGREQLLDLPLRELLAVEGQADVEVQQRVHAQGGRRLAADRDGDLGTGPVLGAPPVGHAHDQPGLLVQRDLAEEAMGLLGRPGQRVVDVAGVDQLADERALFGRAGQGRQQREQLLPVPGPGVVLERPPERQVLRLGLPGDLVNIGGDEGKGKLGIALVLGQVEADAADHVPDRAVLLQVALDTVLVPLRLGRQGRAHVGPELAEQRGVEELGALHGRHRLDQGRELVGVRVGNDKRLRIGRVERTAHPATNARPTSRQYESDGGRSVASSAAPRCSTTVSATHVECLDDAPRGSRRKRRAILGRAGLDVDATARRQPTDEGFTCLGSAIEGELAHSCISGDILIDLIFAPHNPGDTGRGQP